MHFNLCEPITWSDIISASASLFTLVAVVVAICAMGFIKGSIKPLMKEKEKP